MQTETGRMMARRSGLWLSVPRKLRLDKRTRFGRAYVTLKNSFEADCGGPENISIMQQTLIERALFKIIQAMTFEAEVLSTSQKPTERQMDMYLRITGSLRADMLAVGLQRKEIPEEDLGEYIRKTYGGEKKSEAENV